VLVVLGEVCTWFLLRSQGNDLGGDQAHYLIAGQAVRHLSVLPSPQYRRDFVTHFVYSWPKGASVNNHAIVQTYPGPHGLVFSHGIGLPLLLSPFIAVGSIPFALLGLFALTALGVVCIHQRASRLAGLGVRGQLVFALALAAPALWLASTQVYPDLISGVLLAAALVEVAWVERQQRVGRFSAWVIAGSLAFVPWLQIKNLVPAVFGAVALAVVMRRDRDQRPLLLAMATVVVAGWALLLVYNQYYFGHLVGLPQPNPTFNATGADRVLALIFDRHQGLLVQVPTVIIGVLGLWAARRTIPWAAGAAALGALSMLVINGTYTSNVPFGGVALAGRFQWTVLPMLLAWAPFLLVRIDRQRARLRGTAIAVAALWVAQGVPILLGDHVFVNATFAPFAPWDPTLYPGWWPGLGQALPVFLPPGLHLAATWSHLFFELLIVAAIGFGLVVLARPGPPRQRHRRHGRWGPFGILAVPLALAVLAALVVAVGPSRRAPQSSLSWSGTSLGGPWSGGGPSSSPAQPMSYPPVELVDVGAGTFRATLDYACVPGSPTATAALVATPEDRSVVADWLTLAHPTDAALLSVTAPPLDLAAEHTARVRLRPPTTAGGARRATIAITTDGASVLSFQVTVPSGGSYSASSLSLIEVASH
jgi:hypothetical protein